MPLLEHHKPIHYYEPDGRYYGNGKGKYPGVGTLLEKLGLIDDSGYEEWRLRVGFEEAERISKAAMARGSLVHLVIEKTLLNQSGEIEEIVNSSPSKKDAEPYLKSIPVILSNVSDVHLIESVCWSDEYRFAGTVDCCARWNGDLSIIDWKTGKGYFQSYYPYQLAAYAIAIEEMYQITVNKGMNVSFTPFGYASIKKYDLAGFKRELIDIITSNPIVI